MKKKINIGLFGVGLDTYWPQFVNLKDKLLGYQKTIAEKLETYEVHVIDAGLVDSPTKAIEAADFLKKGDVEIVFLFISTYALSSTVLPIAQRLKVPVVLLNLQPAAAIDYAAFNKLGDRGKMTGEWLGYCQACSVPEIASVFNRTNITYDIVSGYLQEAAAWDEIENWVDAARVVNVMRNNRMGILGHYYNGMLDVYSDTTRHSTTFGTHIELLEMCELKELRDKVSPKEIETKLAEFNEMFDVSEECAPLELERAAQTSVAMDKLTAAHNLGSLAYYYEGANGNEYENIVTSVIAGNTLLTGKNIPVAGECEVKNVQAMKIMDALGAGGSFSEFYAMDFNDDVVLL